MRLPKNWWFFRNHKRNQNLDGKLSFGTPGAGPIIRLKENEIVKCDFPKTCGFFEITKETKILMENSHLGHPEPVLL